MGMVLIDQGVLTLALQAMRRDAADGRTIRGEIADEIEKSCAPLGDPVAHGYFKGGKLVALHFDDVIISDRIFSQLEKRPLFSLPTHNV